MYTIPRIKICCITSIEEMEIAVRCGASALGLVSHMPSGPGVISEELISEIAARVPPAVSTFLLTSRQTVREVAAQHCRCRTSTIQLCDQLIDGGHEELRTALPGIAIVQVIHITGPESVAEAVSIAPHVNGLLLDSGNPTLKVKTLGGTGQAHDWNLSRRICEAAGVPVFLAGGLNPDNVAEAIRIVKPFGVDVCSGVRTDGHLDEVKLAEFVRKVKTASIST
ncbi:phosphoribosylanthranilate isomerase [candidate division KSB1 bacterium]|nr:MAG: phosphoribosylanthranilate isomerase [candidate division KSB1 bacterium]